MSSRSLNKVQLIGNLTRDPELRYTPQGTAVCSFGLATNRSWTTDTGDRREETEFHRIVAWAKLAELCSQLLFKGRRVYVEGRLQTRQWTAADGAPRSTTEVVIDDMIILDSKHEAGGGGHGYGGEGHSGYNQQSGGGYSDDYTQGPPDSYQKPAPAPLSGAPITTPVADEPVGPPEQDEKTEESTSETTTEGPAEETPASAPLSGAPAPAPKSRAAKSTSAKASDTTATDTGETETEEESSDIPF